MNALTPITTSELTMSSREIAELTGKQHAHVCRDIRKMFEQLEISASKFGSGYLDTQNQQRTEYNLPKDLTITLVAGYRVDLRHKIVKRWLELEEKGRSGLMTLPNFSDPIAAARAWADEAEAKRTAQTMLKAANDSIALLTPRAEAYEEFLSSDGVFTITQVANALHMRTHHVQPRDCRADREAPHPCDC